MLAPLAPDLPEPHRGRILYQIVSAAGAMLGYSDTPTSSRPRPAIFDTVAAVVIATLALAVFLCVAAVSPIVWTFASDAASQLRGDLSQCLSVEDGVRRLACYDQIAHRPPPQPAKGANAPAAAFRHHS